MHDHIPLYLLLPVLYALVLIITFSVAAIRKRYEAKPEGVIIERDRTNHEVI